MRVKVRVRGRRDFAIPCLYLNLDSNLNFSHASLITLWSWGRRAKGQETLFKYYLPVSSFSQCCQEERTDPTLSLFLCRFREGNPEDRFLIFVKENQLVIENSRQFFHAAFEAFFSDFFA